jgi:hypothetical protein
VVSASASFFALLLDWTRSRFFFVIPAKAGIQAFHIPPHRP